MTALRSVHAATALVGGALATFRITRLVTTDEITRPLREKLWDRYPPESTRIGYLVSCDHCTGIYAAAAVSALTMGTAMVPAARRHHVDRAAMFLVATFAMSGAVSLYHDYVDTRR